MPKKPKKTTQRDGKSFSRHDVEKALRIPRAILEQNAGKECTDRESAEYVGVGFNGPFSVEISSAIKYGFLERPKQGRILVTERARKAIRPQDPDDTIQAFREAVTSAPVISEVYAHYRGENLPDREFLDNTLTDKFSVPPEKVGEFHNIFTTSLQSAKLVDKSSGKTRLLDISKEKEFKSTEAGARLKELEKGINIQSGDSCFVVMPFKAPLGDYYKTLYEPAITKAGLVPVRADTDIFGTGKIIEQIWRGINNAKVLVAELTSRNPNVFYELGLAHALQKPVVLISSNEEDVPFDLQHIRVIYYDVNDPFWGQKLIDKITENVLSAIKNPEEAIFQRVLEKD